MNHLDFSLPEIRRMVDDTHKPVEVYVPSPHEECTYEVVCNECRGVWRCRTVVALEEWRDQRQARLHEALKADWKARTAAHEAATSEIRARIAAASPATKRRWFW